MEIFFTRTFAACSNDDGMNEHNHVTSYSSDVMLSLNAGNEVELK